MMNALPSLPERELPPGRHRQLKEHLMQEIQQDPVREETPSRRRWRLRPAIAVPAAAGALAIAVTAGLMSWSSDDSERPVGRNGEATYSFAPNVNADTEGSAAELLTQVAAAAAGTPAAEDIREDQYVYIRSLVATAPVGDDIETELSEPIEREEWLTVGGADIPAGEMGSERNTGYDHLQTLPTDPGAMLEWLRSHQDVESEGRNYDQDAFVLAGDLLRAPLMPPDVGAALFGALARIPDVLVVPHAVDAAGRDAIAVVRYDSYNPGLREELMFDKDTLELIGSRSVATQATDTIEAGQVLHTMAVLERAVVDEDGERP
ncbi:CU044_5270 family protein [Streptomyces sp. MP131-18]|uniref:CU044_5270 family protein n=1 Tax=Streptomyces sp. MP131-18 TaxID=1857892 RepID=UPI0009CE75FA|nr:hypothetical protein STBA_40710 [Streptomyces sp. MP131-18]